MFESTVYDAVVVGGGPAGATAAADLARNGHQVLLLDRGGRIKPCGGAVPPRLVEDFHIPETLLEARVTAARMVSPANRQVDMDIGGYVGMVDREVFDEWLRERAAQAGAERVAGQYQRLAREPDATVTVHFSMEDASGQRRDKQVRTRLVIGADGATSKVARQEIPGADRIPNVFAYHEIVESPEQADDHFDPQRCDVYYQGRISPDFYGWIFPHGGRTSIGTGTAQKGFSLRQAVTTLRQEAGLEHHRVIRREGAPIPLRSLKRWDNGRDVILAGDAAGVVAPSSGEGIYYAMTSGRRVAEAVHECLESGQIKALAQARRRFMKEHGRVFFILGIMQRFWYVSDKRRERFVKICRDPDVQRLTWEAYMNKRLVRAKPMAHVRIFFKDLAHLMGLAPR